MKMSRCAKSINAALLAIASTSGVHAAVTMNWATVGYPGNAADTVDGDIFTPGIQNLGAVTSTYRIAKEEVTNAQYAEYLNTVNPDGTNPNGIYQGGLRSGIFFNAAGAVGSKYELIVEMGNKPVNWVSWYDAARFANWMNNGQGAGSTETGAYDMTLTNPVRLAGATVFLPSENEWYKAAYYDPENPEADALGSVNYWLYPTQSDTTPTIGSASAIGDISNPGPNVANYLRGADWDGHDGHVTSVGSATSTSFFGAFDMGGNLWEWTEPVFVGLGGLRGGWWGKVMWTPKLLPVVKVDF